MFSEMNADSHFYLDSKHVSAEAIGPSTPCPAAIMVQDMARHHCTYGTKRAKLARHLAAAELEVEEKKKCFDIAWVKEYGGNTDFWSFQTIVRKLKELQHAILEISEDQLKIHLQARFPDVILKQLLQLATLLVGWKNDNYENVVANVIENPRAFLMNLCKVRLMDPETHLIVKSSFLNDGGTILNQVPAKVSSLYLDIFTHLPKHLKGHVVQYIEDSQLPVLARVCKNWKNAMNEQTIWKRKALQRGWGIMFKLPKTFHWKDYYIQNVKSNRKKQKMIAKFADELKNATASNVGRVAKRLPIFLRQTNEYDFLMKGKSSTTQNIFYLELLNEVLVTLEDLIAKRYQELASASDYAENDETAITYDPNSMLKLVLRETNAAVFRTKLVHELVLEIATKRELLSTWAEKHRKNFLTTTVTEYDVKMADLINDSYESKREIIIHEGNTNIFSFIASLVKIIQAFERGVQMGKYLLFQHRVFRSLAPIRAAIDNVVKENEENLLYVTGDTLMLGCFVTFAGSFGLRERVRLQEQWSQILQSNGVVMKNVEPDGDMLTTLKFVRSELARTPFFRQNAMIARTSHESKICFADVDNVLTYLRDNDSITLNLFKNSEQELVSNSREMTSDERLLRDVMLIVNNNEAFIMDSANAMIAPTSILLEANGQVLSALVLDILYKSFKPPFEEERFTRGKLTSFHFIFFLLNFITKKQN